MRIGIGLSLADDSAKAGTEAVRRARKTVPRPDLALVFGSIHHDQRRLHAALCRALPDPSVLMGGSSYAEVTNAGVSKRSVAALLLSWKGSPVSFADAKVEEASDATGAALARALGTADGGRPLALLFGSVGQGRMMGGLIEGLGGIPVFGGMCCGDYDLGLSHPDFWTNYQYCGPRLERLASRAALIRLPKDAGVSFAFEHGWDPVGPAVTFTRAEGPRVFEVDGLPVFDYYRQFLGSAPSPGFFDKMVQRYGFSVEMGGGLSRLKLPVAYDMKKGHIDLFPPEQLQGRRARMIQSGRGGLLAGARTAAKRCRQALGRRKPALVLMVSCCTRNAILHSRMDDELAAVREVMGEDTPVFGLYSGGEIAPAASLYEKAAGSLYHTTTVCLMAIAAPVEKASVPGFCVCSPVEAVKDPDQLRELLVKSEETLDGAEDFLANMSRKSYEDGERLRRQADVIHRYTPHEVWKRAGESAAKGVYEVADSEYSGAFLFMDVQGFTAFSEKRTPSEVVAAINRIFDPATRIIYEKGGDVDKYIGDCIFAAFPDPGKAAEAGCAILRKFAELRAEGSPFSVRMGINAGRAVRANVGSDGRREYTFIGDAVNLAQRLESNCAPGKMLLSVEVYEAAPEGSFSSSEKREITVKNRKQPVTAYECEVS